MLRVLHAAVSMYPGSGVIRQMEWEQQAADALGLHWRAILHTPKVVRSPVIVQRAGLPEGRLAKYLALRQGFYQCLRKESEHFDLVLLRHSVHDFFEARLASQIGPKLITVHHTLEMSELRNAGGAMGALKATMERTIGRSTLSKTAGIVGVTEEILRHERSRLGVSAVEKPGFVYTNGVVCSSTVAEDERGECPELIFVANFADWHGLDLLLDAMERDSAPCLLRLVGLVPDALAFRCRNDPRIVLHGAVAPNKLAELMRSAWCGISSLALFRQEMSEACTLKVREYLDNGLPVYAGHRDSGFPDEFPWFRNGPVSLSAILEFASVCRKTPKGVIKQQSLPYIAKEVLLQRLYGELCDQFGD